MVNNIYDEIIQDMTCDERGIRLRNLYEYLSEHACNIINRMQRNAFEDCSELIECEYDEHRKVMRKFSIWQNGWDEEFDKAKRGANIDDTKLLKMIDGRSLDGR